MRETKVRFRKLAAVLIAASLVAAQSLPGFATVSPTPLPGGGEPIHALSMPASPAPSATPPGLSAALSGHTLSGDAVGAPQAATLPQETVTSAPSLEAITLQQRQLAEESGRMDPGQAREEAAPLFEGPARASAAAPEEGPSSEASRARLGPASEASQPASSVPSPAKPAKKKIKLWKKIVLAAVLAAAVAATVFHFFIVPRLTPVKPPSAIVDVQKNAFALKRDDSVSVVANPDPANKALRLSFKGPAQPIKSAAMSDDLKTAVTISEDGSWRLWDLEKGEAYVASGYKGPARAVMLAEGGKRLVLLDEDGRINFVAPGSSDVSSLKPRLASPINLHAFSPDGVRLALATKDGDVLIVDLKALKVVQALKANGSVIALGSSTQGTLLLTLKGINITLLSLARDPAAALRVEHADTIPPSASLTSSSLNKDGTRVLVSGVFLGKQTISFIQAGNPTPQRLYPADIELGSATVPSVALDGSGELGAILLSDGRIWLWEIPTDDKTLLGTADKGGKISISADGKRVITTSASGAVQVWETGR